VATLVPAGGYVSGTNVIADAAGMNAGTFSPGLILGGVASGESIASQRVGGNQFGLDFYTQFANRMSISNVGNVGIGTLAPLAKLDARGDVFVGLTAVPDNTTTPGNNIYLADDGPGADSHNSFRLDSYSNNLYVVARSGPGSTAGTGIVFRTAPPAGLEADRMVITKDGYVGIGTPTDFFAQLEVNGIGGNAVYATSVAGFALWGQATGSGNGVVGVSSSGTAVRGQSVSGNIFDGYGGGGASLKFHITNSGDVHAAGTFTPGGGDFAELLPADADLEAGDVLVIGRDGVLTRSTRPRQISVAGVYSTKPGFVGGETIEVGQSTKVPLAVVGIVEPSRPFAGAVRDDLQVGDLLVANNVSDQRLLNSTREILRDQSLHVAKLITGKEVVDSAPAREEMARTSGAAAVDMETETIAEACAAHTTPLLSLRAISDTPRAPLPAPPDVLFDIRRQRTNLTGLAAYLIVHPSALGRLFRFSGQVRRARESLAKSLIAVLRGNL
jgi:hypothetical protein